MTGQTADAALDRALTVGGIGRAADRSLSPVTRGIYAALYGKACAWKLAELHSSSRTFTPEQVAQYALWLVEQGYARSTAGLAVRAIRWGHRVAGEPVPDGLPASYVLREAQDTPTDHAGVNDLDAPARRDPFELLAAFVSGCKPGTVKGQRDLALINLLYHLGLTVDDLSALDLNDVGLAPGDEYRQVEIMRPSDAAWLPLRHLPEPGHYATMCGACTVGRWYDVLDREYGQPQASPLFRSMDRGHNLAGTSDRAGGSPRPDGRLGPKSITTIALRGVAADAGIVEAITAPAAVLRIAGAAAAYAAGEIDRAAAARRAGFTPGSAKFAQHLLELTAPDPMGTNQ
jgi:hypothetical protein